MLRRPLSQFDLPVVEALKRSDGFCEEGEVYVLAAKWGLKGADQGDDLDHGYSPQKHAERGSVQRRDCGSGGALTEAAGGSIDLVQNRQSPGPNFHAKKESMIVSAAAGTFLLM